jgi:hypothetical protein
MPEVNRTISGEHTQSVLFHKAAGWTPATARKWLKDEGYFTDGLDETEGMLRFRQYDPDGNAFRYRNKLIEGTEAKPSITLVLAFPLSSSKDAGSIEFQDNPQDYEDDRDLLLYFNLLHDVYPKSLKGERVIIDHKAWSTEAIVDYYVLIRSEMKRRDMRLPRRSDLDVAAKPLLKSASVCDSLQGRLINVRVLAKHLGITPGTFCYDVGISPGDYCMKPEEIHECSGHPHMLLGKTLSTEHEAAVGDVIAVSFTQLDVHRDEASDTFKAVGWALDHVSAGDQVAGLNDLLTDPEIQKRLVQKQTNADGTLVYKMPDPA